MDLYQIIKKLETLNIELRANEPMSRHTSFKIGGPVDLMIFPKSTEETEALVPVLRQECADTIIIGKGTNLLASDEPIHKVAVKTFDGLGVMRPLGDSCIAADSGVLLSRSALLAREMELTGMEFAHGIPGTLGGAITMNAGAYGGQMADIIKSVTFLDENGRRQEWGKDKLDFAYRHSIFCDNDYIILGASLELARGDGAEIKNRMDHFARKRRESQPLNLPSAGSTFKRPKTGYAAALIEQAGLKGYTIGGAQVSGKHSGFVVNLGEASFNDVCQVMEHVSRTVFDKFGVQLLPEVKIIQ